jgi:hypothetical protein
MALPKSRISVGMGIKALRGFRKLEVKKKGRAIMPCPIKIS